MTIRTRLRNWFRFLFVSALMIGALARSWPVTSFNHGFRLTVLLLLLAGSFTLFCFGFRCPRCGATMLRSISATLTGTRGVTCACCGTSIDAKA